MSSEGLGRGLLATCWMAGLLHTVVRSASGQLARPMTLPPVKNPLSWASIDRMPVVHAWLDASCCRSCSSRVVANLRFRLLEVAVIPLAQLAFVVGPAGSCSRLG